MKKQYLVIENPSNNKNGYRKFRLVKPDSAVYPVDLERTDLTKVLNDGNLEDFIWSDFDPNNPSKYTEIVDGYIYDVFYGENLPVLEYLNRLIKGV